jgi:hypothetical protein
VRLLFGIADERILKIYRVLAIGPDEFRRCRTRTGS